MVLIAGLYALDSRLGRGSFGQVYLAHNTDTKEEVAIKLEHAGRENSVLFHEYRIYQALRAEQLEEPVVGIPKCLWYGHKEDYRVLILQRLGKNLNSLCLQNRGKLSLSTVCQIGVQAVERLEFVHRHGYVHRDIKPENFLVGHEDPECLYLVDFGLSKKYVNHHRQHIRPAQNKRLVGTPRYSSLNSHLGQELVRRDDMESLGFVLLYLLLGSLPWQGQTGKNREEKYANIARVKGNAGIAELCQGSPPEFQTYFEHVRGLEFTAKPNYRMLRELFRTVLSRIGEQPFEWLSGQKKRS
ncbi:MAG: casein kinase 1 family protein [Sulfobacillus sp.]